MLEPALALAVCAREGPLDVAEQLAFQNVFAQRRTVQGHKRLVLARAVQVDGPGHQLLAGSALARDQHRGARRGDLLQLVDDLLHLRRVAHHALEAEPFVELLLELDVGPHQALGLRGLVDHRAQLADIERLGQVRRGAGLHGGDGRLDRAVAGEDHHLGIRQFLLGFLKDLDAADAVHDQVGQHDVELLLLDQAQSFPAAGGDHALVAHALEALGHGLRVRLVVVDYQNSYGLFHVGSWAGSRSMGRTRPVQPVSPIRTTWRGRCAARRNQAEAGVAV